MPPFVQYSLLHCDTRVPAGDKRFKLEFPWDSSKTLLLRANNAAMKKAWMDVLQTTLRDARSQIKNTGSVFALGGEGSPYYRCANIKHLSLGMRGESQLQVSLILWAGLQVFLGFCNKTHQALCLSFRCVGSTYERFVSTLCGAISNLQNL